MNPYVKSPTGQQQLPASHFPSQGYKPAQNKPKSSGYSQHQQKTYSYARSGPKAPQNNPPTDPSSLPREPQQQELLVMTIDLGDGTKDLLKVFEGNDPYELAIDFCERHGLNQQLIEPLAQNIHANMEQVIQESLQTLDMGVSYQTEPLPEARQISDLGHQDTGKFKSLGDVEHQTYENTGYSNQDNYEGQYQPRRSNNQDYNEAQYQQRGSNNPMQGGRPGTGTQGRREVQNVNQYQNTEKNMRGSAGSRRYEEDAEMYEMAEPEEDEHDHYMNVQENMERQMMVSPKNVESSSGNGVSSGIKENYQGYVPSTHSTQNKRMTPQRGRNNPQVSNAVTDKRNNNLDYPSEKKGARQWGNEEFQSEEEYLEYLINSQYGVGKEKQQSGRYELTFVPNINEHSKQMVGNKPQGGQANVYDRLHNQAKFKNTQKTAAPSHLNTGPVKSNNTTIQQSQMQGEPEINYGTLLYYRGVKKSEENKKTVMEKKKAKLEELHQECTFKPNLNRISKQIMTAKGRVEDLPDTLIKLGQDTKEKMERARSVKAIKEMDECTFRPEINILSRNIDYEKEKMSGFGGTNRNLKLFYESKLRQEQQESLSRTLSAEYTFKPMTNDYTRTPIGQTTFEQRDMKFRERKERINEVRQIKHELETMDPETGEPLFKPKTGRAPKVGRNHGNLPIGEYLYNQQYKLADTKRRLHENHERTVEANMARSSEKSHAIVENMMRRRLEDIFRKLDSDGDGLISSAKIDITPVGTDVLETLAPLLCEMEEKNQVLDFEGFLEQTERLLRCLTVTEKDKLLLGKREGNTGPQFPFQPEIGRRSERLAYKKHPYGDFQSLYGTFLEEKNRKMEKIKEAQERKTAEEMKECSFRPKIYASPKSSMLSPSNNSNLFDLSVL